MKVYSGMAAEIPISEVAGYAQRIEGLGYDGLRVAETVHDGMLLAALALDHTTSLQVSTAVVVAFPRSPMVTAIAAWDLQALSGGRFGLGLGTQIKQNIEGRFSVPWGAPIERMEEYVGAVRAIWEAFVEGGPLDFQGEHYRFSRLQPFFNPGPIEHPDIPVLLGGVNPRICELAGRVADGFVTHPTNASPRFVAERIKPGLDAGGREVELIVSPPVITGADRSALDRGREHQRRKLGFLYSTPAYGPSLELYGWDGVGDRLRGLARSGRWDDMAEVITDDMLDALVPQGTYDEIADVLLDAYGGLTGSIGINPPDDPAEDGAVAEIIRALQAG